MSRYVYICMCVCIYLSMQLYVYTYVRINATKFFCLPFLCAASNAVAKIKKLRKKIK